MHILVELHANVLPSEAAVLWIDADQIPKFNFIQDVMNESELNETGTDSFSG